MVELKKLYSKLVLYVSLFIILIVGIIIFNNFSNSKTVVASYVIEGNTNSSVVLKDGNKSNQKLFVSQSVDDIVANFNYKYIADKTANFKYKYEIIADVITDADDTTLDETEINRVTNKLVSKNYENIYDNILTINDKVALNYDYYNKIASDYNNSINIATKSRLLITFNLYILGDDRVEKKYTSTLSLPLEKNTFSITKSDIDEHDYILSNKLNTSKLIINIVLVLSMVADFVLITYEIKKLLDYKKKHILEFKYRKIMQDYDNIVVPINRIPKDDSIVSVKVLYFKSMIDIQKELHIPILCYRGEDFILFMIINNKLAYIYFLNNSSEKI